MLKNIVLSGGSTMMPGFAQRVREDLQEHTYSSSGLQIIAEGNRNISTWIGMSMLSSMSTFNNMFITRETYNDSGENYFRIFQKIL